jgi:hypothetical protein
LQSGTDDLTGGCAEAIDQDRHREARESSVFLGGPNSVVGVAAFNADDRTAFEEQVGNLSGLAEQAAGIESQVENEPLQALFLQGFEYLLQFIRTAATEVRQADICDLAIGIEKEIPTVVWLVRVAAWISARVIVICSVLSVPAC